MKKALVCGAGGFIGGHLVKKLQREGYWVRGVDIKPHEWSPAAANEFLQLDLRVEENCQTALTVDGGTFDEVYQLLPIWAAWASFTLPKPRSCTTAC